MTQITPQMVNKRYEQCRAYNDKLNLYDAAKRNEDFFKGKQWEDVVAPDLMKPVLNFTRRVVTYFISQIVSDDIGLQVRPFILRPAPESENGVDDLSKCEILEKEIERVMERCKLKGKFRRVLQKSAVCGDGCLFFYNSGNEIKAEVVSAVNVMFGNYSEREVQEQPFIIISQRLPVHEIRRQARANGQPFEEIMPQSDSSQYMSDKEDDTLATLLTYYYKDCEEQNGITRETVHYIKVCGENVVKDITDLGYRLYPIAFMNWQEVENSYHGQSVVTEVLPNQIFVNKLLAMAMRSVEANAFPTTVYNSNVIDKWNNKVGAAIGIPGDVDKSFITNVKGGDMSNQVMAVIDAVINYTKEFMGASDAALGNITNPQNTSAILAVQKNSTAPLELQKFAFYQLVEDCVRIITDIIIEDYGQREVNTESMDDENSTVVMFDFGAMQFDAMEINVDVGPSSYFSEITSSSNNDALINLGILDKSVVEDCITYMEGVPIKQLPSKNRIIERLKAKLSESQQQAEQQAQIEAQAQQQSMQSGGDLQGDDADDAPVSKKEVMEIVTSAMAEIMGGDKNADVSNM